MITAILAADILWLVMSRMPSAKNKDLHTLSNFEWSSMVRDVSWGL